MGANIIGQTYLNQFRVDEFIASGGMGAVYRVTDLKRNVSLAMKVLHAELADDPTVFKRFQREAQALKRLKHPNIVPFYGLYQDRGTTFLLEAFIPGSSLQEILKQNRTLPLNEALIYMKGLCAALGYAHSQNIVHCDVKPGNVMVGKHGGVYLADFGIVRFVGATTTTTMGVAGTPSYMAPEQITGHGIAPTTDIYALGVMLYEMLTGQRPFRGTEPGTAAGGATPNDRIRYGHLRVPPPDPRQINANISPTLAQVILRALAKNPTERFQSAQDFFNAICQAAQRQPEQVSDETTIIGTYVEPPYTPAPSTPRPMMGPQRRQRNIALVFVGGALVLLFVLGMAVIGKPVPTPNLPTIIPSMTITEVGTATVISTMTSTETITVVPTESPTVTPASPTLSLTSQPHVSMLGPERVGEFSNAKKLGDLAEENHTLSDYNRMNETLKFTVNLNGSQPLIWRARWCTKKKNILDRNLTNINFQFSLNSNDIPINRFAKKLYINSERGEMDGWSCMEYWTVLTDWEPGNYQFLTRFDFLAPINDGVYDYPQGWKALLYNVTVK